MIWESITRIERVEVPERTDLRERAVPYESAAVGERAVGLENTEHIERAARQESTGEQERAESRESTVVLVRADHQESTVDEERAAGHEGTETAERTTTPALWITRAHARARMEARQCSYIHVIEPEASRAPSGESETKVQESTEWLE